jgi:hypothetical protein
MIMAYQITKANFDSLLKTRKGNDFKMNPYKYVAKLINDQYGILGGCSKVIIKG